MQLIYFYLAIFLVFFLPGYFLMRAVFAKNYSKLASLEKLLITFVLSLASTDAMMLLMNYLNISIDRKNLLLGIVGVSFVFGVVWIVRLQIYHKVFKFGRSRGRALSPTSPYRKGTFGRASLGFAEAASEKARPHSFSYSNCRDTISTSPFGSAEIGSLQFPSYRQILLFIVLLGFSIFLRSAYIADGIFPKTTDFGHHMYWANYISTNHVLPTYDEKFIIGEHLPFATVSIISGISYVSALPVIILFLFNFFNLIAVFILVYWLALPFNKVFQKIFPKIKKIDAYDIALWGLFIIGILYPISAPQVKFVSGGVIGNIIGNLLIVTAIYAFLRVVLSTAENSKTKTIGRVDAYPRSSRFGLLKNTGAEAGPYRLPARTEKVRSGGQASALPKRLLKRPGLTPVAPQSFVSLFLISVITLVYTHHLSSFIFIYSFITILFSFIILTLILLKFNLIKFFKLVFRHIKPFFYPLPLFIIFLSLFFLFQLRTPSYLNPEAIDVAVGTPTKITRVGFGFSGILERVGSWRILFAGIFGVIGAGVGFYLLKNIYIYRNRGRALSPTNPYRKGTFGRASLGFAEAASEKARSHSSSSSRALDKARPHSFLLIPFALSLAILFAWTKILFLMSWKPDLLKVDIPSRRIVTYLTYPMAIMASFGFAYFFAIIKTKLSKQLVAFLFLFFIGIGVISGFGQDITANQRTTAGKFEVSSEANSREVMQTYLASIYLATNTSDNEIILKDHKALEGDTWMKIFFMRGYKYPLSRTYDRRYEDVINKRETCTRDMILKPNSEIGKQCFAQTKTKYIVLKKGHDDALFLKSDNFQEVYSSKTIRVFEKFK